MMDKSRESLQWELVLAAWVEQTAALGPGSRFAFWLQGCPFTCPGCIAPEFQPIGTGHRISVDTLFGHIAQQSNLEGITVSGGEPMLQAEALVHLLRRVHDELSLSIILYSGYRLAELRKLARRRHAIDWILALIDVLIDGRYDHALNDSRGLRGSTNQVVHLLTERYRHLEAYFKEGPRYQELHQQPDGIMVAGLPTLEQWVRINVDANNY